MPHQNSHKNAFAAKLKSTGLFSNIDIHFAGFIAGFSRDWRAEVFLAAALVSRATANGNICLNLEDGARSLFGENREMVEPVCPPAASWRRTLLASPAVGRPDEKCPLILDDRNRLYLYRYWRYEKQLSRFIRERTESELTNIDVGAFHAGLAKLFPPNPDAGVDWQKLAAAMAVLKSFSVITGGPGTGKTHTIAAILALLLASAPAAKTDIILAAPTGKAAARLGESIKQAKRHLDCSEQLKDAIPVEVHTIHRMLKPIGGTPYFKHDGNNPLPADMVVVDEASMVDLALMSKLVQAVAPETRLLLVGDKDQLASVEAGSVLGDICGRQVSHGFSGSFMQRIGEKKRPKPADPVSRSMDGPGLRDCIAVLQKSYRFSAKGGIGGLSRAVNHGDAETALTLLKTSGEPDVNWIDIHSDGSATRDLKQMLLEGYAPYLTAEDPAAALAGFNRFKVLCALNNGPFGVNSLNRLAEQELRKEGLIPSGPAADNPWYPGRPVLITENDYNLGLFNGDIGIAQPGPDLSADERVVYFPGNSGEFRRFSTHRLGRHETVFAMTVHKSQGSEFDHVVLILPDMDTPLLTRELLYTGLTRARRTVTVMGTESIFKSTIFRRIKRASGLREALWGE